VDLRFTGEQIEWLFLSIAACVFSVFFAYYIFPSQASILAISFTVIALTPHFYKVLADEEEIIVQKKMSFFCGYERIMTMVTVLAIGMFMGFSLCYELLPSNPSYSGSCNTGLPCREAVFSLQSAYSSLDRGPAEFFALILFCFALSVFLGAGAILIIALDVSTLLVGSTPGHMGFILYLPQLLAFFLTGLSGALLSFAIVRHEWRSHCFLLVVKDSLIFLGAALLIGAATVFTA
jgi:hypothetical protein